MNAQKLRFLTATLVATAALSFSPAAVAQTGDNPPSPSSPHDLQLASKNDLKWRAEKLAGEKLTTRGGKKLGSIKDFLIEADSGRVRYAVVSTGGFIGVGDTLHLVPYYMLSRDNDGRGFTASITTDMLSRAPAINEESFEENRVLVDAQQRQQIIDAFSASRENVKSSLAAPGRLVRATKLKGQDVMANGVTLGSIKGIVIERGATHALAVFEPSHQVASGDRKFLVPISRLKIEPGKGAAITTTLMPSDFQAAEQGHATAEAEPKGSHHSSNLEPSRQVASGTTSSTAELGTTSNAGPHDTAVTPTGRTSAEQNGGASPDCIAAAHSIRQALDADSSTAQANVQVTPGQGRVLVHGTVGSDEQKAAIERAADNAASAANIDFDLTVRNK